MSKNIAVFGIYPTRDSVEEGVARLRAAGFRPTDVSVLLPENAGSKDLGHEKHTKAPEGATAGAGSGAVIGGTLGWLAGVGAVTIPGMAAPLIAAGPLLSLLAGVGAGGAVGGMVGGLIGAGVPEYEAKRYEGRIRKGGVLLSVHCDDSNWARKARKILQETGAEDLSTTGEAKSDFAASDRPHQRLRAGEEEPAHASSLLVRDIMHTPAQTVRMDALLSEASEKMKTLNIGFLAVHSSGKVVGVLTDRDITIRASADALDPIQTTVSAVMTTEFACCIDDQEVREAAEIMKKRGFGRLLVLDRDKELVGVLTVDDIATWGDEKLAGEILKRVAAA